MKKRNIIIILAIVIFFILFFINKNDSNNFDLTGSKELSYKQIDYSHFLDGFNSKVNVAFFEGHKESYLDILFTNIKHFKELNVYEKDKAIIVIYEESKNSDKGEFIIRVAGLYDKSKAGDMEIYINGILEKNIKVNYVIE